jgi:hypothetical protein
MKPKKIVSKSVAMALGIICIILIALTAYFTVTGISARDSYNNLQNQKKQLQTWLDGNETLLSQIQVNNTNLQNQVNNFTDIVNLGKSTVWVSGGTVNLWDGDLGNNPEYVENVPYAGCVAVYVSSPYCNETTVKVTYSSQGLNYTNSINLGTGGTALFPVLPSSSTQICLFFPTIYVLTGPIDATVTITYYY